MKKGFTLIELLVVIAIIGILSSVVISSLSKARMKSRVESVQSTLGAVIPIAIICLDNGESLNASDTGQPICGSVTSVWPKLPSDWVYSGITSDPYSGVFVFSASSENDEKSVSCEHSGCTIN